MQRRDWSILGVAGVVLAVELGVWLAMPPRIVELPPAIPMPVVQNLGTPVPMPTVELPHGL